jgi:hypothetical protein
MSNNPDPDALAESIIAQVEELREAAFSASPPSTTKGPGKALNFRIDPEVDRDFRITAVQHGLKLSELLVAALAAFKKEHAQ